MVQFEVLLKLRELFLLGVVVNVERLVQPDKRRVLVSKLEKLGLQEVVLEDEGRDLVCEWKARVLGYGLVTEMEGRVPFQPIRPLPPF